MIFRGPFFNEDSTFLNVGAYFFLQVALGTAKKRDSNVATRFGNTDGSKPELHSYKISV